MALRRPTEKNTKTEILSAFDELLKEKKALETQLLQKPPKVEQPPNGKTPPPPKSEMAIVLPVANQQKMEDIIENLNRLQLGFGGAVSDLSEKLTLEAFNLQEIQRSRLQESEQLQQLHNLEFVDGSLDTLIQQYEDSAKTFDTEFRQQRESVEQAISESQKAWEKAQEDHQRSLKERNETFNKTRQRNTKEYTYDLTLQRKLSTEEYEQEKKQLYQALEEVQKTQETQWAEREKAVRDRETQFAELKAKVEAQPKELEAATKRAKEEGKGIAAHQAKVKADLMSKEIEGQKRTYELRVAFLEETIADQQTRLQTLSKQLDVALKQVQDLAVKAIEGASDISSFEAVREIALEQAKGQNKVK